MPTPRPEEADADIDIGRLAAAVWARKFTVLLSTVGFAGLAFVLATLVPPTYKADTQIVVESRESSYTRSNTGGGTADGSFSPESVESQVSLITSADILGTVSDRFKLATLPEFAPKVSLIDRIITRVRPESDSPQGEIIEKLRQKLQVYRKENQRVLVIEFSSRDPALARDVPNAIADEYLARQKGALLSSNTNATGWLEQEIADLRETVRTAEGKVADFRSSSDLLVGQNQSVLATQQLSEIATELSRTRAARAAAEGRAQSIRDAIKRGVALDTMSEVLSSPTIQALRERQVSLRAQIADLSTTLLENHPRLRALRSQSRDLQTEITREAAKVQASLETEADSSRQRETSLTAEMERLKTDSARAGGQEVELRSLEREAQSQSQLLESYLSRYREAVARGARDYLPVDARIFSEAQLPAEPYFPKVVPITAAAGLFGFLFAVIALLLRELFSGRALKPVPRAGRWTADPIPETASKLSPGVPRPVLPTQPASSASVPDSQPLSDVGRGRHATGVVELGEAILASEIPRVLVVPAIGESRSASVALARQLAGQQCSTILVDLTPGNAAARAMGVPDDAEGAGDLVDGMASFADVIHRDLLTSAHVLPSGGFAAIGGDVDATEEIGVVLEALGKAYDCTMVDCGTMPPETLKRLMDDGAALVVAVEPGEEAEGEALMQRLSAAGLGDIVLMHMGGSERVAA